MKEARPFLEDGSQFGISRTAFRRMRTAEKRELMVQSFHENVEDPAERTPCESAEGGYQWIWGGPFDAQEELDSKFGGLVPESLIEEVVEEIERDGLTDWAPTPSRDDYDEVEPPLDPASLDVFLDQPNESYGTSKDHEARVRARAALDQLSETLEQPSPIGIGHNRPPAGQEEPDEIKQLRPALAELRAEFAKPNPAIQLVKRWAEPLRNALIACSKWIARKVDKAVDAAATIAGGSAAVALGTHYSEALRNAFEAVVKWLEIVARHVL